MNTVEVAGLHVFADTKTKLLELIQERFKTGERTVVYTTYSEFLFTALKSPSFLETLNSADLNLPDGVSVIWAYNFLKVKRRYKNQLLELLHSLWVVVRTGSALVLAPANVRKRIPETISGADLFWDILKLAEQHHLSVFFFGGLGAVPSKVAEKAKAVYPNLQVAGYSNRYLKDPRVVEELKALAPDILLVAVNPQQQEIWIQNHKNKLPSLKFIIGLGGTFDYVVGKYSRAPKIFSKLGLEWCYRLITQPWRLKRIAKGVLGLIFRLVKYKLKTG